MELNRLLEVTTAKGIHEEIQRRAVQLSFVNAPPDERENPLVAASRQVFEDLLKLCCARMNGRQSAS
jgi:hypothetical protein